MSTPIPPFKPARTNRELPADLVQAMADCPELAHIVEELRANPHGPFRIWMMGTLPTTPPPADHAPSAGARWTQLDPSDPSRLLVYEAAYRGDIWAMEPGYWPAPTSVIVTADEWAYTTEGVSVRMTPLGIMAQRRIVPLPPIHAVTARKRD